MSEPTDLDKQLRAYAAKYAKLFDEHRFAGRVWSAEGEEVVGRNPDSPVEERRLNWFAASKIGGKLRRILDLDADLPEDRARWVKEFGDAYEAADALSRASNVDMEWIADVGMGRVDPEDPSKIRPWIYVSGSDPYRELGSEEVPVEEAVQLVEAHRDGVVGGMRPLEVREMRWMLKALVKEVRGLRIDIDDLRSDVSELGRP